MLLQTIRPREFLKEKVAVKYDLHFPETVQKRRDNVLGVMVSAAILNGENVYFWVLNPVPSGL